MATISIVEMALTGERRAWSFDTSEIGKIGDSDDWGDWGHSRDTGDERVPLREIIRWRVREEVAQRRLKLARDLPQPSPTERALNGPRMPRALTMNWEQEYTRALAACAAHQIIILVNDRQVDDLDTLVTPSAGCEVVFLRLTPLVGG
jgi:hypothetical protein